MNLSICELNSSRWWCPVRWIVFWIRSVRCFHIFIISCISHSLVFLLWLLCARAFRDFCVLLFFVCSLCAHAWIAVAIAEVYCICDCLGIFKNELSLAINRCFFSMPLLCRFRRWFETFWEVWIASTGSLPIKISMPWRLIRECLKILLNLVSHSFFPHIPFLSSLKPGHSSSVWYTVCLLWPQNIQVMVLPWSCINNLLGLFFSAGLDDDWTWLTEDIRGFPPRMCIVDDYRTWSSAETSIRRFCEISCWSYESSGLYSLWPISGSSFPWLGCEFDSDRRCEDFEVVWHGG